jgi:hypothetical protein
MNLLHNKNLDSSIVKKFYNDKGKLDKIELSIKDYNDSNLILNTITYKNDFPIILNEIKKFFYIPSVEYYITIIENKKYLVYENNNCINLKDYIKEQDLKNDMRCYNLKRVLAFNYLMCINSNFENKIYVFPNNLNPYIMNNLKMERVNFKTINEKSFKYDCNKVEISNYIIKEWFNNSLEDFRKVSKDLVKGINPEILRQEMLKICKKYNDDYVSWVNSVYSKILEANGF